MISWINFTGEIEGGMALDLSNSLIQKIAVSFGVENVDEVMAGDTVNEIANQVLAQVKSKVEAFAIKLTTPIFLKSKQELIDKLGSTPALLLDFSTSAGGMSMIFQIER